MPLQMSEADSTSPDVLLLVSGDSPLLTLVLLPQTVLLPTSFPEIDLSVRVVSAVQMNFPGRHPSSLPP